MLDIDAEMHYWRAHHGLRPFFSSSRKFETYLPTLKFGYDTYLLNYHQSLEELMPVLSERYENRVPSQERVDWHDCRCIVEEVWKRMGGQLARA